MKIILKIVPIILLAAMLIACAANDRQVTEAPTTNASEASTAETEPSEQVKTFNFTEPVSSTSPETTEPTEEETEPAAATEAFKYSAPVSTPKPTEAPKPTETTAPATAETEPEPTPEAMEETEAPAETDPPQTYGGLSDADINRIATVVCGEVGSMCGNITLTYSDGSKVSVNGDTIRMMHAMVVVNQYRSAKFPSTVSGCIRTYWSPSYDNPYWQSSSKWQNCRQAVINALCGGVYLPSNVFGATQDASFGNRYPGYWKYARVDWNTGWVSGTYYYYAYG